MAIRKGQNIFGSLGRVVLKVIRGQQVLSSKPGKGKMKQTANTKAKAKMFGIGSSLAKTIREGFEELTINNHDGTFVYRLTAAVNAVLRQCHDQETQTFKFEADSFNSLIGLEFNADSPVKQSMWFSPQQTVEGNKITLTIPQQKIPQELKFPKDITTCRILVHFQLLSLKLGSRYIYPDRHMVTIEKGRGILEKQEIEFTVPEGCLALGAFTIEYFTVRQQLAVLVNNKTFHPGAICAAYLNHGTCHQESASDWIGGRFPVLE